MKHYSKLLIVLAVLFYAILTNLLWQDGNYLLLRTAASLSSFHGKAKRLAFKACLRCMGGDISAVVASASRRPRTSPCLVNVSSRAVR